jgi:hypothetical protein
MDFVRASATPAGSGSVAALANLDANRRVRFVDELDRVLADVGVHGHVILRDVCGEESTKPWIYFAHLSQTSADSPHILASRE